MKTNRFLFLLFILSCSASEICNAQAGEWAWMKGDSTVNSTGSFGVKMAPSSANEPPARYACGYWTDTAGNFWIYGGLATTSGEILSDLWKFDAQTLKWTWMAGSSSLTTVAEQENGAKGVYTVGNSPG